MSRTISSTRSAKRRDRAPSGAPPAPTHQSVDGDVTGIGEVYLNTFGPPALASSSDVYMQIYALVRAVLKGTGWRHAATAVKAAWDAAAQHVEQTIGNAGGDASC